MSRTQHMIWLTVHVFGDNHKFYSTIDRVYVNVNANFRSIADAIHQRVLGEDAKVFSLQKGQFSLMPCKKIDLTSTPFDHDLRSMDHVVFATPHIKVI